MVGSEGSKRRGVDWLPGPVGASAGRETPRRIEDSVMAMKGLSAHGKYFT